MWGENVLNYKPDRRLPLLSAVDIVARSRSPHFASITHTFHPPCRQQGDPLLQQSLMGPSIIICYPNWNPLTLPAAPALLPCWYRYLGDTVRWNEKYAERSRGCCTAH